MALAISCVAPEKRPKINRRGVIALAAIGLALLSWRGYQVYNREPKEGFKVGFHLEEQFAGGRVGQWIEDRAVWVVPAGLRQKALTLDVATFLPGVADTPQELVIRVGDVGETKVTLADNKWKTVRLYLPKRQGPLPLHFRAKYELNPAKQGWSKDNRDLSAVVSVAGNQ